MSKSKQNLLTAFDDLLGPRIADEIPEGFYTAMKVAKDRKWSTAYAYRKLNDLADAGKLCRKQYRNANGRVCWFYGVK